MFLHAPRAGYFLCLLLCCIPLKTAAQLAHRLDSLLQADTPRAFNGVVLVAQKGKPVYYKAKGEANREKHIPLKKEDVFIIGSLSKQITAVLVLQEMEKGHLHLTDTLHRLLPGLTASWADSVTLEQLLTHTSGLVSPPDEAAPLLSRPGTAFHYSNYNFMLLAQVAARTSGKPYETLVKELFRRCGMMHSSPPKGYQGPLVTDYAEMPDGSWQVADNILELAAPYGPSGATISTAADLLRWNQCLHGGKLLQPTTYQLMTARHVSRQGHRWGDVGYGFGLQVDSIDNIPEISHNGNFAGFIATDIYLPQSATSIIILENVNAQNQDRNRTFYYHDLIREWVRQQL